MATPLWATLVMTSISSAENSDDRSFAPLGQSVRVFSFKLAAVNGSGTLSQISFSNSSTNVFYNSGITELSIFKQTNPTVPLNTKNFENEDATRFAIIPVSDTLASGNSAVYFVKYTISDNPSFLTSSGDTANTTAIQIEAIKDGDGQDVLPLVEPIGKSTITLTGFRRVVANPIAPSVVVAGQTGIPMLAISAKAIGEACEGPIQFKFRNTFANLSTTGAETGVKTLYLLKDDSNLGAAWGGTPDYASIQQQITNGTAKLTATLQFNSTSEVVMNFSSDDLRIPLGPSSNYILVYDIGSGFPVTANTFTGANIADLKGTGSTSKLTMQAQSTALQLLTPARSAVAGLAYTSIAQLSANGNFGSGTILPILQFNFLAYQTTMNIETISIRNSQDNSNSSTTIPFITNPSAVDGVTRVRIFQDNGNGDFDGIGSVDTLVGDLTLGNGNQNDRVDVPITKSSRSFLAIPSFNPTATTYALSRSQRFFVVYNLGNLSVGRQKVVAQLQDSAGFTHFSFPNSNTITTQDIVLTGTKPASPAVTVNVSATNVAISSTNIITPSPAIVVRGRQKVPMMTFQLNATAAFASASITIRNESSTYFNNGKGVNRVWLYQDKAPLGVFDANDVFIASNSNLVTTTEATLNGVSLSSGENYFILLYDVGQNATVDTDPANPSLRAQLSSMSGTSSSGSAIVFGGQTPAPPLNPAQIAVKDKSLALAITSTAPSNPTSTTFNITFELTNSSSSAINILDIQPRFYFGSLAGGDVSSQFNYKLSGISASSFTLAAASSQVVTYAAKFVRAAQAGSVVIDGSVQYQVAASAQETRTPTAILSRYQDNTTTSGWVGAATPTLLLTVQTVTPNYTWTLPDYIKSMESISGSVTHLFFTKNAVPQSSSLKIYFQNTGKTLDSTAFTVALNGANLPRVSDGSATLSSYSYNSSTGVMTITNVGTQDGSIVITAKDLEGVSLSPATITFLISDSNSPLRITEPLFYPNPARGGQALYFGVNLTTPATIKLYVYNHLGSLVWSGNTSFSSAGYKLMASAANAKVPADDTSLLSGLANVIGPGIYICKIVGSDSAGHTVISTTKFAVY